MMSVFDRVSVVDKRITEDASKKTKTGFSVTKKKQNGPSRTFPSKLVMLYTSDAQVFVARISFSGNSFGILALLVSSLFTINNFCYNVDRKENENKGRCKHVV